MLSNIKVEQERRQTGHLDRDWTQERQTRGNLCPDGAHSSAVRNEQQLILFYSPQLRRSAQSAAAAYLSPFYFSPLRPPSSRPISRGHLEVVVERRAFFICREGDMSSSRFKSVMEGGSSQDVS